MQGSDGSCFFSVRTANCTLESILILRYRVIAELRALSNASQLGVQDREGPEDRAASKEGNLAIWDFNKAVSQIIQQKPRLRGLGASAAIF